MLLSCRQVEHAAAAMPTATTPSCPTAASPLDVLAVEGSNGLRSSLSANFTYRYTATKTPIRSPLDVLGVKSSNRLCQLPPLLGLLQKLKALGEVALAGPHQRLSPYETAELAARLQVIPAPQRQAVLHGWCGWRAAGPCCRRAAARCRAVASWVACCVCCVCCLPCRGCLGQCMADVMCHAVAGTEQQQHFIGIGAGQAGRWAHPNSILRELKGHIAGQ